MENCSNGKPKLILNPRIGQGENFWPASRVADLFWKCQEDYSFETWIIAGFTDQDYVKEITDRMKGEKPRTISLLELDKLGEMLRSCNLFIGPDGGTSRLAASLGVPCIILFGPTKPAAWAAPSGTRNEIIWKGVACSPCSLEYRRTCRSRQCFTAISIREVIGKIEKISVYITEQ
ncbi:MAG: glycosyltransferase family 9 protein [bacterium]